MIRRGRSRAKGTGKSAVTSWTVVAMIPPLCYIADVKNTRCVGMYDTGELIYSLVCKSLVCIRYGWGVNTKPKTDVLRSWFDATYGQIARTKRGDMHAGGFEVSLLSNFSPIFECVRESARTLRQILFEKGALNTITPTDPDLVYQPMVLALEDTSRVLDRQARVDLSQE
jgi:hypothetical protein